MHLVYFVAMEIECGHTSNVLSLHHDVNMATRPIIQPNYRKSKFNLQHDSVLDYLRQYEAYLQSARVVDRADEALHCHQVKAVLRLYEYFKCSQTKIIRSTINPQNSQVALVVLPTGCGKTGVAVLASYVLNADRVLVITPSLIISKQIDEAYDNFLVKRGIIHEQHRYLYVPQKMLITKSEQLVTTEPGQMRQILRLQVHQADLLITNAHKISDKSTVKVSDIPNDCFDLVIVDEAHHYPAKTWKQLIDHFPNSKKIFLTATPEHNGEPILKDPPYACYRLSHDDAVSDGVIRKVNFYQLVERTSEEQQLESIVYCMENVLDHHDEEECRVKHQGMVITQTKEDINSARKFCRLYNNLYPKHCEVYDSDSASAVLDRFKKGEIRTLVIIRKLLEGFDHKPVSVLGIVRNIAPTSRVLFAQFVGRAVRKTSVDDPINAQIVTHACFKQKINFNNFDKVADVYPEDEE